MTTFSAIVNTGAYLLVLFFGTHFIRTVAFNRYEAVTFECSSAAFLLSVLVILRGGATLPGVLLALGLLAGFIANAMSQWHFYMKLHMIIRGAFESKALYLKKQGRDRFVNECLQTMASVAIMPSFSRFIEESKLFNNPGSFIGLVKSLMKRQRFQKKKYQMRECFADNVNMIGPCRPMIGKMMVDRTAENVVPGVIHEYDLALGKSDEIKGLASFDILGFGALLAIWAYLAAREPTAACAPWTGPGAAAAVTGVLIVFSCFSHVLRHFAFARYESVSYELSFAALVAVSFGVFRGLTSGRGVSLDGWLAFGSVTALFLLSSVFNHRADKALHKQINEKFSQIIFRIPPETETDRTKRKFLQNLKVISEWAVVPFPGGGKASVFFARLLRGAKMREFEENNEKKKDMARLMEELVDEIVPECRGATAVTDFALDGKTRAVTRWIMSVSALAAAAIVAGCVWTGTF